MRYVTGNTLQKWEELKNHPFHQKTREELIALGEKYLTTPIPVLSYSDFCRYYADGNRSAYERPYQERRRRMLVLAVLTRLYGEKYLGALLDVIWAILDENVWSRPAHIKEGFVDPETRRTFLDLASTETGANLAECDGIVGELIPSHVRDRMRKEVRERIIEPFFRNVYWWMEGTNNWGAVCSAQVMLCITHFGTVEEFYRAEPTMNRTVLNFIASYGSDGCCTEGVSYWYYGFGLFVCYADIVRNYTREHPSVPVAHIHVSTPERPCETLAGRSFIKDGVIDYFARRDVHRAALFAANMRLNGNATVSFSDGPKNYYFEPCLLSYLKKEYPDEIRYPARELARSDFRMRDFLWSDPLGEYGAEMTLGTAYYEEAQWFIDNKKKYSLAAKGGHNDEAHNHNDVGSFLITTEKGMGFADLGSGEYTRQYFDNAYRYDLLVCSSRGHSVPIVNGRYQERPENVVATAETDGKDFFSIEYSVFYGDPTLTRAQRSWTCDETGVTVIDAFTFSEEPKSLAERFVSLYEPVLGEGTVTVQDVRLSYDKTKFTVSVTAEDYSNHVCRMQTVYLIDLLPKTLEKEAEYTFRFDAIEE